MPTRGSPDSHIYSKTYRAYCSMRARCVTPSSSSYKGYGAKGVLVSLRWLFSYKNFLADLGECPSKGVLDRIDPSGHYTPTNCRWVTVKESARNKRNTIWLTHNGVRKPLAVWAEEFGMQHNTLSRRIRAGWSTEKAFTTSLKKGPK